MSNQENIQQPRSESQATEFASQILTKLQKGSSMHSLSDAEKHFVEEQTGGKFSFGGEIGNEYILEGANIDAITVLQNYIDTQPERGKQAIEDAKSKTSHKQLGNILNSTRNAIVGIAGATAVGAVGVGAAKLGIEGYNYVQQSADNGRIERAISNDSKLAEQKARKEKDGMIRMIDYKTIQNPETTPDERAALKKKLESK
jgi:hypothetical protein